MSKLKPKHELFLLEYLKDRNGTHAAIRAGYSEKTAQEQSSRLLSNVKLRARLDELMERQEKRLEISADKILKDIDEIKERCMQKEQVLDEDGKPTGEWKFESFAALKACELLGKHLKLFTDRVEHSISEDLASKVAKAKKRLNE